jgi:uncharacterized repeat protein (TIGR01451 family)
LLATAGLTLLAGYAGVSTKTATLAAAPPSLEPASSLPGRPHVAFFPNFFDRHAVRLAVQPAEVAKSVQSRQVFIASIYDEEGKPRRNRRIEWLLEGAGNIVEVDESGFYPGKGYKVDDKYAVGFTDWLEHTIKRGDDPEGFLVRPGQTWCIVTSAVEGDTKVTAYAPEIDGLDKNRIVVTTHWVDADWHLPPAVSVRAGAQQTLTTDIFRHSDRRPLANYQVRYRVLDGPQAGFLPARGAEAVALSDPNGNASVTLTELELKPGVNRVGIEIVHPSGPGMGAAAGTTIARGETRVEWQAPQIGLSANLPPALPLGQDASYTLLVANTGQVESQEVTVRSPLPEGLQYVRSKPAAIVDGNQLVWTLPGLPAGGTYQFEIVGRPTRPGPVTAQAAVSTRDGLRDERSIATQVTVPRLDLKITGSESTMIGGAVEYRITVNNSGTGPANNVVLLDEFDAGLEHESKAAKVQKALGTLAPGEIRTESVVLTARQAGKLVNRISASGDGNLKVESQHAVNVLRGQLKIELAGPARRYVNQAAAWKINVANTGELALNNVVVKDLLPPGLVFVSATDGGIWAGNGEVAWTIASLPPGQSKTLELKTNCAKLIAKGMNVATAKTDIGLQVQAEAPIEITGLAVLKVKVRDTADPVAVGGRTSYEIDVINRGTLAGSKLELIATVPPQMKVVGTRGPTQPKVEGDKVIFPALDSLPPGQQIKYGVDVQALQPGKALFQVDVRGPALREPLLEQESTTIYDPNGAATTSSIAEPPQGNATERVASAP